MKFLVRCWSQWKRRSPHPVAVSVSKFCGKNKGKKRIWWSQNTFGIIITFFSGAIWTGVRGNASHAHLWCRHSPHLSTSTKIKKSDSVHPKSSKRVLIFTCYKNTFARCASIKLNASQLAKLKKSIPLMLLS